MPLSKYFRLEALTLIAFLATIPIYSPNHLLFETGVFDVPTFMAPFANTMLFSTLVLGTLAALASGRRCPERLLGRGWVVAGVAAYLTGYGLLIAAAALPGVGTGAVGALSGFLLAAGTVELAVLWGSYMAAYDLRQALLWCALSVGCAALVGLLLSSTTFGVGLIVFVVLVLASFPVPCLAAWKRPRGGARPGDLGGGAKAAGAASSVQEAAESPAPTRRARLASLASVSGMPLAGLMVFAFMMGARKFILFDVVNMELLGCALGAVVALPICLLRTSRPLTTLIYRMLVPAFALVLIVLNSFPGTTMPMFFAAWLTYVFYGAVAILALASLAAVAHARELSAGSVFGTAVAAFALFSLLGLGCAPTAPFQEEGGGPALLVVSTFYFVGVIAAALWGFWRAGALRGLGRRGRPNAAGARDFRVSGARPRHRLCGRHARHLRVHRAHPREEHLQEARCERPRGAAREGGRGIGPGLGVPARLPGKCPHGPCDLGGRAHQDVRPAELVCRSESVGAPDKGNVSVHGHLLIVVPVADHEVGLRVTCANLPVDLPLLQPFEVFGAPGAGEQAAEAECGKVLVAVGAAAI